MSTTQALRTTISQAWIEMRRPGESELRGRTLWRVGQASLTIVLVLTNLIGALAIVLIANFVLPLPGVAHAGHVRLVNALVAAGYVAVAVPVGVLVGTWRMFSLREWLVKGRQATDAETRIVLLAPLRLCLMQLLLWLGGAILFALLNLTYSLQLAERLGIAVALTGAVTASCAYLLTERLLRPAAARALADEPQERVWVPGVATRSVLAWLLGSALPVFGVVAIGILALAGDATLSRNSSNTVIQLGVAMVVLGGVGTSVGLLSVALAARTTADPIDSVRRALNRVREGDFDVRVPVYDGTQIGQLQLGFNQMVSGLAERERIRETFGTYVDPEVASHILEEGTDLAGEEVVVTIMFIDIRDFTGFAEQTSAERVVAAINELFEQIVPAIHEHGGRVDKYVGDGLLAVFGAPRRLEDHADRALQAARQIAGEVSSSDDLAIGIGLNSGQVVAGNIGGDDRFEFSVIGDAVNVAARVEAATRDTGDAVLLTENTKELLSGEHGRLTERTGIELRGRQERVRLYAPEDSAREDSGGEDSGGEDSA